LRPSATAHGTSALDSFPALCHCFNLSDVIAVSSQFSTISTILEADVAAAQLAQQGLVFDLDKVFANDQQLRHFGILSALQTASSLNTCATFHTLPNDPPFLVQLSEGTTFITNPDPQKPFTPNNGIGVDPYNFSSHAAIAAHLEYEQRAGLIFCVTVDTLANHCFDNGIPFHLSSLFLAPKLNSPLQRLIPDFKGINTPFRKDALTSFYGPITTPSLADVCQLYLNALTVWPHEHIYGIRGDVSQAFYRTRPRPRDRLLLAMLFEHLGFRIAAIPFTNRWGDQVANYSWQPISNFFLHLSRQRTLALGYPPLTNIYTDDFFGFGSYSWTFDELQHFAHDLISRTDENVIATHKNLHSQEITLIGWQFHCINGTLSITERSFLKLICLFFVDIPAILTDATTLSLNTLQRLSSYAMRYADAIRSVLFASRGFANNLRHVPSYADPTTPILLTTRSIHDIQTWRAILALCVTDISFMTIPIKWPPLLQHLPTEVPPRETRSLEEPLKVFNARISLQRQPYDRIYDERLAQAADLVAYSDACTPASESPGVGFIIPPNPYIPSSWFSTPLRLPSYYTTIGDTTEAQINVYELIGILTLIYTVGIQRESSGDLHTGSFSFHLHIWTDSSAALWWCRSHRFDSPFHGFLLTLFSFLQIRFNMLVTVGHIKGLHNFLADAASRLHLLSCSLSVTEMITASHNLSSLHPVLPSYLTSQLSLPSHEREQPLTFALLLDLAGYNAKNRLFFPQTFTQHITLNAALPSLATSLLQAAILTVRAPPVF
jgi:hypothetical protein